MDFSLFFVLLLHGAIAYNGGHVYLFANTNQRTSHVSGYDGDYFFAVFEGEPFTVGFERRPQRNPSLSINSLPGSPPKIYNESFFIDSYFGFYTEPFIYRKGLLICRVRPSEEDDRNARLRPFQTRRTSFRHVPGKRAGGACTVSRCSRSSDSFRHPAWRSV